MPDHLTDHHAYLTRREAQERAAALQSVDLAARRVHAELAELYAQQIRAIA